MIFFGIFFVAIIVFIISEKLSWCPHTSNEDKAQSFMEVSMVVMMISFSLGVLSVIYEQNNERHCKTYLDGSLKAENKRDWNYEETCSVYKIAK